MIFEVLRTLFILAIVIPFVYIISASVFDILKKIYGFYKLKTKPVLVRIVDRTDKYRK